ncbi:MAG: hypothetical protein P4M11_10875 [Candidatus Pacebacteria bacterium]|nr:hypothetical protein [Candidatus Paceibacterota bacterium]
MTNTQYSELTGFLLVEELRQEFFQTYPELMKTPLSNPLFSSDKRYLNEICRKYNAPRSTEEDDKLAAAKLRIEGTTAAMRDNVVMMMGNQEQAKVRLEMR